MFSIPLPACPRVRIPQACSVTLLWASAKGAQKRNGELTAANSVGELVCAVGSIKEALVEPVIPSILCPSPKRRKDAIQALVLDSSVGLTPHRKVKLITCFRQETSVADTYCALAGDNELRAGFLQDEFGVHYTRLCLVHFYMYI